MLTFCHFLSLSVTFGPTFGMCHKHVLCTPMALHGIVTLFYPAFKLGFLQKYLFKTTKRCECSLFVTFCHFLSLSVTFGPTFGRCHKHVLCTPMPPSLQGIVILWCREFKLVFFRNLFKTTQRCECSLFVTFDHFLSLHSTF